MRTFSRCAAILALMVAPATPACSEEPAGHLDAPPIAHISVRGRVVDFKGKPCPEARVFLRATTSRLGGEAARSDFSDVLAETRADAQGQFRFETVPIGPLMEPIADAFSVGRRGADVVALADGFGIGWTPLYDLEPEHDVTVTLASAATLEGTVSDEDGQAIEGADLEVLGISRLDGADDHFLEEPDSIYLYFSTLRPRATSDADGRFRIVGLPSGRRLSVRIAHADHPPRFFAAATGEHPRSPPPVWKLHEHDDETAYVNPVQLTLGSGPRLEVHIVDENGQPLGGGSIAPGASSFRVAPDGTSRMAVAKPGEYRLLYTPPDDQSRRDHSRPGLQRTITLSAENIAAPKKIELRLPAARLAAGRVVAQGTDDGVPGVRVLWTSGSPSAKNEADAAFSRAITDGHGRFQLAVLPGVGQVALDGHRAGFFVPGRSTLPVADWNKYAVEIDVPDDAPAEPLRIEVSRGLVVRGRLLDGEKNPVAGMIVRAAPQAGSVPPRTALTDRRGRFEIAGLSPRDDCMLTALGDGFVAALSISGDAEHSLTDSKAVDAELVLEPAVTLIGRVLIDDEPLANVRLVLRGFRERRVYISATTVTGDDGRYRLCGLKPGDTYNIEVWPPVPAIDPRWHHQSAFVPTLAEDAAGEVTLPDMKLLHRSQSLAGVVVDPDGQPVAGAQVSAGLIGDGGSLFRASSGPVPWTKSDARGRFHLLQLPEEPLELTAYIEPKPGNNEIRFAARATPMLNQQDIRIVLDPTLVEEE